MNINDCFEEIKFCKTHSNLLASEARLIKKYKPKLNYQLGPDKGSRVTLNIFNKVHFILINASLTFQSLFIIIFVIVITLFIFVFYNQFVSI